MKAPLVLIALMCSTSAFARIGETAEQIDKRYGRPLERMQEKGESRRYLFRGFTVLVGLEKGISQCELYHKQDNSRMMETEIRGLLQVNTGRSPWRDEPDENMQNYVYWSQDKRTRVAIYNLATHRLMITSKAFLPRYAHLVSSGDGKKMDGF